MYFSGLHVDGFGLYREQNIQDLPAGLVLWLGDKRLFALDCARNRMAEIHVKLPDGLYTHECALVYDPGHDVCVALIPGRFSGPMQTFLYRFDPGTAKVR